MKVEIEKDHWHEHWIRKVVALFSILIIVTLGILFAVTIIGIPVAMGLGILGAAIVPYVTSNEKIKCSGCEHKIHVSRFQLSSRCPRCKQNIELFWIKPKKRSKHKEVVYEEAKQECIETEETHA